MHTPIYCFSLKFPNFRKLKNGKKITPYVNRNVKKKISKEYTEDICDTYKFVRAYEDIVFLPPLFFTGLIQTKVFYDLTKDFSNLTNIESFVIITILNSIFIYFVINNIYKE